MLKPQQPQQRKAPAAPTAAVPAAPTGVADFRLREDRTPSVTEFPDSDFFRHFDTNTDLGPKA